MVLEELKNETNPVIKRQFDIFENRREDDADELHERFDKVRLDMDDIHDCFEVLKNVTLETPSEPYFLSILQHLLFIRDDMNIRLVVFFRFSVTVGRTCFFVFNNRFLVLRFYRPAYFKLIEEVVSQIVLHKSGLDPDFKKNHVDIDLQPLLDELKGENSKYLVLPFV